MGANHIEKAGRRIYEWLCGRHPYLRPWHFQWLIGRAIYRDFRRVLPTLGGRVLDVGCGDQPYRLWLDTHRVREYIGADIRAGDGVDLVLHPGFPWELESASVDSVLCSQVLEHVADLDHVLAEVHRVLKPGGTLVLSVPFFYNEHGVPFDFRRLSGYGVEEAFRREYDIIKLTRQGRIGSTLGTLLLNWVIIGRSTRVIAGLLMPLWILTCAMTNGIALLLDTLDRTDAFYMNVLLVARKKTM